jgi:multidrug resistance efflux pump
VELEATPEELQLREQTVRARSVTSLLTRLNDEIALSEQSLSFSKAARTASLQEAEARAREAQSAALLSEAKAQKYERLQADGILSQLDGMQQTAEAKRNRATAEALRGTIERIREESSREIADREAHLVELRKQAADLRSTRAIDNAEEARLLQEVARRTVLAPVDGVIGEVTDLRPGSFAGAGTHLATIIPDGQLQVSGDFDTQTALGRIRPGQAARLRLFSFPWTEYGQIHLLVSRVSDEPRDGVIRVECDFSEGVPSLIKAQHGLTGILEVETGKVTPAALILREAGYRWRFGGVTGKGS